MFDQIKEIIELFASDPYERTARLYPALLAFSPIFVMVTSLYYEKLTVVSSVTLLLMMCGLIYMLSNFSRSLGKKHEKKLWDEWGGMPSVQVLRHRDTTISPIDKKRYHLFLARSMNIDFPDENVEIADPDKADMVYDSACRYLRSKTRDAQVFPLIFKENITYGFRRNCYGLKIIGIICCFLSVAWIVVRKGYTVWWTRFSEAVDPESFFSLAEVLSISWAVIMLLAWIFYVNKGFVKEAASCYSEQLVMSCDTLKSQTENGS